MGVSGVGKTTVGSLLAKALHLPFFDGDDFHPTENVQKMKNGNALNDEDRQEWLNRLNSLASKQLESKKGGIIACSALKEKYRKLLIQNIESRVEWIYLKGTFEQIQERIQTREGHFMPTHLLQSQFDTLEAPTNAHSISIDASPEEIVTRIKKNLMEATEFGVYGLGVMGKSIARNLAQKKVKLSLYNRHVAGSEEKVAETLKTQHQELSKAQTFDEAKAFVNSLQRPRKILLMVSAGKGVDAVIEQLTPFLAAGDILIDGGNSHYQKTQERYHELQEKGIHFIGMGISGGEEGALKGPSMMPGGDAAVYNNIAPILNKAAARDQNGNACCTYIGPEGSGHFVKMVHNGIEYAEMQLLAEVVVLFKNQGKNPDEIAEVLSNWKATENSYLLEITTEILRKKEGEDWLIHKIMDKAGNKGTGNWTTVASAQLGMPSTMMTSSLFARYISFFKEERTQVSKHFKTKEKTANTLSEESIQKAYRFARIINHHQGFKLIKEADHHHKWNLNLSELARIWTNGCIIRSDYMVDLVEAFKVHPHLFENPVTLEELNSLKPFLKEVLSIGIQNDLPLPLFSEALQFLNQYALEDSSANIIQAQRDYFGAHTYQRKDDPSGKIYHSHWNE